MSSVHGMQRVHQRQQGAALVVGLILLVVLTILAVSGMLTSTMELRMVRNTQSQERAFQAAEVAVENALANPLFNTLVPEIQAPIPNPSSPGDQYEYRLAWTCTTLPGPGYGVGEGGFMAYHFQVDAAGTGPDSATAQHTQGFFVIGPPDSPNCAP